MNTTTQALPQLDSEFIQRQRFARALQHIRTEIPAVNNILDNIPRPSRERAQMIRAIQSSDPPEIHSRPLLSPPGTNPKLSKAKNVLPIWSLSLAPAAQSGKWHVCPASTPACEAGCLGWYSGHAGMGAGDNTVRRARRRRTEALMHPDYCRATLIRLAHELETAAASGPIAVRLNTFSDIPWETVWPDLFTRPGLKNVIWYDYTKIPTRRPPACYHLTLSWTPQADRAAGEWLARGGNVAVVFGVRKPADLPRTWRGYPVLDGTASDERWQDPAGHIVGLTWRASRNWKQSCAQAQASGWVVEPATQYEAWK
jgi:hypothetical protein